VGRPPKHWEIGFLRQEDHNLTLTIDKDEYPIGKGIHMIRIETEKGIPPDYDSRFVRGYYDVGQLGVKRKAKPASQDGMENFRWVLNLESKDDVPHGHVTLHPPTYGATVAYIHDAVFYALNQSSSSLYMVPLGDDPNDPMKYPQGKLDACEIGWTNRQIGADITCEDDGKIIITFGDQKIPLPNRPGHPWKISLMNMRPHHMHDQGKPAVESARVPVDSSEKNVARPVLYPGDFQIYYDAISVTSQKIALWGNQDLTKSGRTDCDSVRLGDTMDLDNLLP